MDDYFLIKPVDHQRSVFVYPLTFGRARIGIGDELSIYDSW